MISQFDSDIITMDYRVRGFTRDVHGRKLFRDSNMISIPTLKYNAMMSILVLLPLSPSLIIIGNLYQHLMIQYCQSYTYIDLEKTELNKALQKLQNIAPL